MKYTSLSFLLPHSQTAMRCWDLKGEESKYYCLRKIFKNDFSSVLVLGCARFATKNIVKFANDTTVVGFIEDDNEGAYHKVVEGLVV